MTELSIRKLAEKWLKDQLKYMILWVLSGLILVFIMILSKQSLEYVWYAILLCGFIGLCFLIIDFYLYRMRYLKLYTVYLNLDTSLDELPKAVDFIEESYQEMLWELFGRKSVLYSNMMKSEAESEDYYTLWVHQIKTPIAAIKLLLQSDNWKSNHRLLEQELFKINQYAEMALHYSHLHTMSSDLVLKEYDLYEIVKSALKKYSISFIEKKLDLNFQEFHETLITDDKWLGFIIEQILSNCIKYTNTGEIGITFREDGLKCLQISDTGIGIREEDLPRIFEKGFTGYNGHMDKKSTGIGLYLCQKAADMLGITLQLESEVGKGTTFRLLFSEPDNLTKMKD